MENFKINWAAARVNAGYTQPEAAKALKVSNKTICQFEKYEKFPTILQLEELEKLYSIDRKHVVLNRK